MRLRRTVFAAAVALAVVACTDGPVAVEELQFARAGGAPATVVGCGTTSSADGEQMKLTGNLSCAGTAVTITHDNVHLDMAGFTLDGDGTGIGILVIGPTNNLPCGPLPGPSGVHINGGTVKEFDHGIFLCRSDTGRINGMTVTLNDLIGILISRAPGGINGPTDHRINGSTLSFNGCRTLTGGVPGCLELAVLEGGLVVNGAFGNVIHTMDIRDNKPLGVLFLGAPGNTITSSQVTDNLSVGVFSDRAGRNTIRGNTIEGHGQGINVSAGGGGHICSGCMRRQCGAGAPCHAMLWNGATSHPMLLLTICSCQLTLSTGLCFSWCTRWSRCTT